MSIKILQEISSLVTDFTKKNRFVAVVEAEEGETKYLQLMRGLGKGGWENEEEAIQDIYNKDLGIKTFEMLKSRAKERLVNMIFQLDTQKRFKSSYDKAYFSACKNLLAGVILKNQNKQSSGNEQLKLALITARKFYFTDLMITALRLLRYASSFSGSKKKFLQYDSELKNATHTLNAELLAEELDQKIILEIVTSMATKDELVETARQSYIRLKNVVKSHDTYTTRLSMYRIGLRYFENSDDYKNAIKLADECEGYLHANPHLIQKVRLGEMNLHKLSGSLHLRDYENGSRYAATCMTLFNPGTLNWLIFLEYHFLLCLHTKNYSKANEIYRQVIGHPSFKVYPPQSKEKWKIFESFLNYAIPSKGTASKNFNVSRFLNEVPIFSKDKAGYNLSIIVAQVLLSLNIGDYNKILDKAEPLKIYASRYISKERNPRSYYFIKMLLVMVKYDFDAKKTAQIANKFFTKLKDAHLGLQSELETLEVIPYDVLWPEILTKLETNQTNLNH